MKLAVLGATGGTGQCLVRQALEAGHHVVAIVRTPAKMTQTHANLQVVEGSIFSAESLQPHIQGCDAVLSCLGQASFFSTVTLYSESCKAIVKAMQSAEVKRFIFMSSWYTKVDPGDDPGRIARWIIRPILSKMIADMKIMEEYLEKECSDIDYTSVRPPQLTDGKSKGQPIVSEERQFVDADKAITRSDVARFMLDCLDTDKFNKKMMAIGVKK